MASTKPASTVQICSLDQFKRQFFHWYYTEDMSLPQVKEKFDLLFDEVARVTGIKLEASEPQWSRRYKKHWIKDWGPKTRRHGEQAPSTDDVERYLLWRDGTKRHVFLHACTPEICHDHEPARLHIATTSTLTPPSYKYPASTTSSAGPLPKQHVGCTTWPVHQSLNCGDTAQALATAYDAPQRDEVPWYGYNVSTGPEGPVGSTSFPAMTGNARTDPPVLISQDYAVAERGIFASGVAGLSHGQIQHEHSEFHHVEQPRSITAQSISSRRPSREGNSGVNAVAGEGSIGYDFFEDYTNDNNLFSAS
ncbi:MAG: hypothetical protein Q9218_006761 [Villophora microphyllina]